MEKNPKTQVTKFEPETIFATSYEDIRGSIYSITGGSHNKLHKLESKLDLNFFHTKIVRNKPGVFRGFHADGKSWKKCTCLEGEVKAIIIDPMNETYKSFILNNEEKQILLIPPGWYNGFLSFTNSIYAYCLSYDGEYIDAEKQLTIKPRSSCYGIKKLHEDIGLQKLILSERDS